MQGLCHQQYETPFQSFCLRAKTTIAEVADAEAAATSEVKQDRAVSGFRALLLLI